MPEQQQPPAYRRLLAHIKTAFRRGVEKKARRLWQRRHVILLVGSLAFVVSMLPMADEIAIPITQTCPVKRASECKAQFVACRGVASDPEMPGMVRIRLRNACHQQFTRECEACDWPVELNCRTWWDRYQKLGPRALKLKWFPGAEGTWAKLFGGEPDCEYRRALIRGV